MGETLWRFFWRMNESIANKIYIVMYNAIQYKWNQSDLTGSYVSVSQKIWRILSYWAKRLVWSRVESMYWYVSGSCGSVWQTARIWTLVRGKARKNKKKNYIDGTRIRGAVFAGLVFPIQKKKKKKRDSWQTTYISKIGRLSLIFFFFFELVRATTELQKKRETEELWYIKVKKKKKKKSLFPFPSPLSLSPLPSGPLP